jgi:DNA-binding winged helix-turn-helix (wHTH) protein
MSFASTEDLMFGPFRLSLRERALWGRDSRIALKSRAFDLMVALIEGRERVVTKAELMRRVWGDLYVEENNLHVQIAAIRRALGAESRCILTVPGRGYRFIGQVRVAGEPLWLGWAEPADDEAEPGGRLSTATARFWCEAGLAGEARSWLARALERAPGLAQADLLERLQRSLADLSLDQAISELKSEESFFAPTSPEPRGLRAPAFRAPAEKPAIR